MSFKDCPLFSTHDDYYTPLKAWKQIQPFINKRFSNPKIFECFLLGSNEQSKRHLEKLGNEVIGNKTVDFLNKETWTEDMKNKNYDLIQSNPPFQKVRSNKQRKGNLKYKCIKALMDNEKPFIILMNSTNMFSKWFKELVDNKDIKLIFPTEKIQYDKYEKGGKIKIEKQNEYLKRIKKEKGYKYKRDLTEEELEEMEKLPKAGSCSFNSIYVCYKMLDKNEWI